MTLKIGHKLHFFDQLESTNNYAMQKLRQNDMTHGEVVWAAHQIKGKGQRGNHWHSAAVKNLLFSIVLTKKIEVKHFFKLNLLTSLAITDYLADQQLKSLAIKWPNDILIEGKKIAGILIETILSHQQIDASVIGIGLNINQEFHHLNGFQRAPSSLFVLTRKKYDLAEQLSVFLGCFQNRYDQFLAQDFETLQKDYLALLFQKEKYHTYLVHGEKKQLNIQGVDFDSGALKAIDLTGNEHTFMMREIRFI